ncbi:MAG: hypothetical protein QG602_1884 [Verrucomicrobiota bacterium]|nr:hypothetical protein [Verrucomicrobiota bacterium]
MIRAFQWDLARQVERLDFLKKLLPRYARWGYEELYLHLEDAVHYPSLPGIGRNDAYTYEELGELVLTAAQCGIRVVPIINLLGHTQYLIKHPDLRDLNELRDDRGDPLVSGQICPLHPRTLGIAEKLLRDMAPYCTAGKVHVGLDESFQLGKCPRCRDEVARLGLGGHFAGHVNRLHKLVGGLGLQMGLWADMLYFVPEAIPQLPAGITAYDWYYYPFNRKPRVEFFNFAERDLHPALKKQGIRYYGCPMNGAFRHEPLPVFGDRLANIRSWWQRCQAVKADGLLITSWEAYRLALETTTVVDAAAANLWLEPDHDDATAMLARGLERALGSKHPRPQARALLAADPHAFAGYARWQINDRWDVFAGEESLKPFLAEVKFFERLLSGSYDWPPAFSVSLAFRLYLARRDVFVRQAARDVFRLRRLLQRGERSSFELKIRQMVGQSNSFAHAWSRGLRAARAMWKRSRAGSAGQNEVVLQSDRGKLVAWRRWLRKLQRQNDQVWLSTPVCGAWQLNLRVHNFAPAVQKILVEQPHAEGSWHELTGRHTIEFRAHTARPKTRVWRELSVPVSDPCTPLRLRVAGVGAVRLSHVALTNGVVTKQLITPGKIKRLGRPAPASGFPILNSIADAVTTWNLPSA